jgi:hypothetical protein
LSGIFKRYPLCENPENRKGLQGAHKKPPTGRVPTVAVQAELSVMWNVLLSP